MRGVESLRVAPVATNTGDQTGPGGRALGAAAGTGGQDGGPNRDEDVDMDRARGSPREEAGPIGPDEAAFGNLGLYAPRPFKTPRERDQATAGGVDERTPGHAVQADAAKELIEKGEH